MSDQMDEAAERTRRYIERMRDGGQEPTARIVSTPWANGPSRVEELFKGGITAEGTPEAAQLVREGLDSWPQSRELFEAVKALGDPPEPVPPSLATQPVTVLPLADEMHLYPGVGGEPLTSMADAHVAAVGAVTRLDEAANQRDLLRLARLVAMGVLRTRSTPDGLKIERRPESRRERAHRVERKRKRQLSRRARK